MANDYTRRGQQFADALHERARESASEYRKLLISLSTGALAFFFLALTTKIEPALSELQLVTLACAILSMAFTTFSGLYSLHADAQRNYHWGKVEEGRQKPNQLSHQTLSKHWKKRLDLATVSVRYSFASGIAFGVVYMLERVLRL